MLHGLGGGPATLDPAVLAGFKQEPPDEFTGYQ